MYCIAFDANCEVRDYAKRLGGRSGDGCGEPPGDVTTIWNCSGGKTPWNTWVSCEEDWDNKNGYCWQVDPYGRRLPQKIAQIPPGRLEAMATDDSGPLPVFYFTEDDDEGAVRRFTPSRTQIPAGWDTLHPNMESDDRGEVDFLVFDNEGTSGTFHWSTDIEEGRQSANDNYRWVEGIAFAMIDGQRTIFFVAKRLEKIFQLNLDTNTWASRSTNADIAGVVPTVPSRITFTFTVRNGCSMRKIFPIALEFTFRMSRPIAFIQYSKTRTPWIGVMAKRRQALPCPPTEDV